MKGSPSRILKHFWGFTSFKPSQKQIIDTILHGRDVLALLPTGGGKSICFQVPALAQEGICIVVSPLISLMKNQVDHLKKKGIKAIAITGGIPYEEVNDLLDNCTYGNYKFLYVSPERLQQDMIRERISRMNVNLIAIDEAHCISQWGHDFRPAYLQCALLRELFPEIPMVALTATATKKVTLDIMQNLKFKDALVVKDSFVRKNIGLKVIRTEDKLYSLRRICSKVQKSAIVYVRTRRMAQELSAHLLQNKCKATFFHGGISKEEKEKRLDLWLSDSINIMVATNAFGMGIDKPDVELVVHFQIPDCLENYFQEVGRAGRDGHSAEAVLITNPMDEQQAKDQFLSVLPDVPFLKAVYRKLNTYFQIPYGEGNNETFQINFEEFCNTYQLNRLLTYNALRLLDLNSVIALSESFSRTSTVQFLASKSQIFNYLEENKTSAPVIRTILRTYGGIFDFETKINTHLVAKKVSIEHSSVIQVLEHLQKDNIILYKGKTNDLEVTFLVPREDDNTINILAGTVREQNRIKHQNLKQMLFYVKNDSDCRSRVLLNYFGEKIAADCGICDVCVARNNKASISLPKLCSEISELLRKEKRTSRQLITIMTYNEGIVLKAIKLLLEQGKIRITRKNEYELT
ncbi:MAG: RecQ family ATP-dependent DNA helicase [Bacteroidota bacterium]